MSGPRIYNLFPTLAGPFARFGEHLPRIAAMGFDWIYLNPFTATGGSGSLYAVRDYGEVNPALRGDDAASDDEILRRFTSAARERGIRVIADLVINHTADDAPLATEHPEWYRHEEDGSVAHPFAVDQDDAEKVTVWGDLAELDYTPRPEREALVAFVTGVAKRYAALGFDGFRCDAAYKVPGDVWKLVIDAVRTEHPATVFFAETLGGPDDEVRQLGPAGFDYIFNSSKWWDFAAPWLLAQYEDYRAIAPSIAFPESHDTPRLLTEVPDGVDAETEYRFRYLFAASFSSGVMMPIGYEYGFGTALDVVRTTPESWETPRFDLSEFVAAVNAMKASATALNEEGPMRRLDGEDGDDDGDVVVLERSPLGEGERALVLVNPSLETKEIPLVWFARHGLSLSRDATAGIAPPGPPNDAAIGLGPRQVRVMLATPTPAPEADHARA